MKWNLYFNIFLLGFTWSTKSNFQIDHAFCEVWNINVSYEVIFYSIFKCASTRSFILIIFIQNKNYVDSTLTVMFRPCKLSPRQWSVRSERLLNLLRLVWSDFSRYHWIEMSILDDYDQWRPNHNDHVVIRLEGQTAWDDWSRINIWDTSLERGIRLVVEVLDCRTVSFNDYTSPVS